MAKLIILYVPEDLITKANDVEGRYTEAEFMLNLLVGSIKSFMDGENTSLILPSDSDVHGNPMYRLEECEIDGVDSKFEIKGV